MEANLARHCRPWFAKDGEIGHKLSIHPKINNPFLKPYPHSSIHSGIFFIVPHTQKLRRSTAPLEEQVLNFSMRKVNKFSRKRHYTS